MGNHYHLVVFVDRKAASALSEREVVERWNALFKLPVIINDRFKGVAQPTAVAREARKIISK